MPHDPTYKHFINNSNYGATVFATSTALDFAHVFRRPLVRDVLFASIVQDVAHYGAALAGLVVMPHHFHLLAALPWDKSMPWLMNRIKGNSAKRILPMLDFEEMQMLSMQTGLGNRSLWKRSYRSIGIVNEAGFRQKQRYIHLNPVRAGLTCNEAEYRWSTSRFYSTHWHPDHGFERLDDIVYEVTNGVGLPSLSKFLSDK